MEIAHVTDRWQICNEYEKHTWKTKVTATCLSVKRGNADTEIGCFFKCCLFLQAAFQVN